MPPQDLQDQLGRPMRDLRLSVTDRCNFRCTYCMPADVYHENYRFLPRSELLSFEELSRLVRIFVERAGVRKLRVTGGEPLLRRQLPDLISQLSCIEGVEDLTLTTNGHLLAEHAQALRDAGLGRVTVSLDSLEQEAFARLSGARAQVSRVLQGIEQARRVGLAPIKVNCVVQRGVNEASILELARYFRGSGIIVRFIEYMDVGTINGWRRNAVVSAREILDRLAEDAPLVPLEANHEGEVASRYAYADGSGEVGIIASVTAPFCGSCSRARLSADGKLITCLFASGGFDLRAALREGADDQVLGSLIAQVWRARADRYSEQRSETRANRRRLEMYQIGG